MIAAKHAVLVLLVAQNTCLVLLMRYSRTLPGVMYLGSTAVCCDELLKLVTCSLILLAQYLLAPADLLSAGPSSFAGYLKQEVFAEPKEVLKMGGLALLYTVQKNLLYKAVSNLDAAVFQITYQAKILTTALFSVLLLRRSLSMRKVVALLLLTGGVALVQLDKVDEHASKSSQPQNHWVGVLAVLGACCTSGFGGVYFEMVLKRPTGAGVAAVKPPSVWAKNVQLSMFAAAIALATAYAKDGAEIAQRGFFQGYSPLVVGVIALEAGGGLVVAVVIKYADNILKSFATAVSIITSTLVSMFFFDFKVSRLFVLGGLLVFVAIRLYSQEPAKALAPKVDESDVELLPQQERARAGSVVRSNAKNEPMV